jgi:phosphoglycerol transferase MdoB-like AlkP superfamily enzyme
VTDQTNEGRTSDAEFTAMTSLLPLEQGAVAFHYPGNHYVGVAHVLAEHGYHTLSAIPYHPGFWNRAVTHPAYGFQQSLFEDDFGKGERIGWGLNDRDFLLQMVPRLEAAPRPFAAWLITLSLHHPYDEFPEAHKVMKLGTLEGTPLGNYLHAMHYFDDALEQFRSTLARDGLLADTVIALYGDHDAGFPHTDETAATIGFEPSLSAWTLFDRVPFFIRVPAPAEGSPVPTGTRDMMAGQTDFGPTLLGLLGIDAAALPYVGRNLLGNPGDPPLVRPRGNWLDAHHLFFAGNPDYMACFDVTATAYDARTACDDEDARAQAERETSHLVIVSDLQEELRNALRASLR